MSAPAALAGRQNPDRQAHHDKLEKSAIGSDVKSQCLGQKRTGGDMLFTCPKCGSKARFASSKQIDKETREGYWQCMNLNCGTVFVTHTCVGKVFELTVK
ncbi:ogr/Delta-like zinc finger family protein [Vibrio fluvialis]